MKQKLLTSFTALLLSLIFAFNLSATSSSSGTCGDSLTWTFNEADSTLTILGSGKMYSYGSYDSESAPWQKLGFTKVIFDGAITNISSCAFYKCSSLKTVSIPNTVTSIDDYAFRYCPSLTAATIANSVVSIGSIAFGDCPLLASVTIPNSVTTIGTAAFQCTALTTITIPNSVTSIGKSLFSNCEKLELVNISNSVTCIPELCFYGCTSLKWIEIPNSVAEIEINAFNACTALYTVILPNSLTTIGNQVFKGCTSLTSFSIPASVTNIGMCTFDNSNLVEIWSLNPQPPKLGTYFQDSISAKALLHVPYGSLELYQSAYGWGQFQNIQEIIPTSAELVAKNSVKVTVTGNEISVEGASAGEVMEVYTVSGQLVYGGQARTVAVPAPGIYLVKVANQTTKVIVK